MFLKKHKKIDIPKMIYLIINIYKLNILIKYVCISRTI